LVTITIISIKERFTARFGLVKLLKNLETKVSLNLLEISLFPFKIAPRQAIIILVCNTVIFCLDLWLIFLLLSTLQPEFGQYSVEYKTTFLVLLAVCAKFLSSLLQIKIDLSGKKNLFKKLSLQLSHVDDKHYSDQGWLNRIVSRDILTLAEQLFALIDPFQIIIESFLLIIAAYIVSGFAGVLGLMGVIILVPISLVIGKLTHHYTEKLFKNAEKRIDISVKWLLYRKQVYLMQEQKQFLLQIERRFRKEIYLRNMDSLLRSLEQYLSIFARPIPMIFSFMVAFVGFNVQQNVLEIFWLSIPAIHLTLRAGRTFGALKICQECIKNIDEYIQSDRKSQNNKLLESDDKVIICNAQWQVWDGSLKDNVCDQGHMPNLLTDLRLDEELAQEGKFADDCVTIEHFGKNISQGQLTRILFGRSINQLVELEEGTLYLKLSFSSLDKDSLLRVAKIIDKLPSCYQIQVSDENKFLFSNVLEAADSAKLTKDEDERSSKNVFEQKKRASKIDDRSLFNALFSLMSWPSFLFFFPAFILGWFGQKTAEIPRNFSILLIWTLAIFIGITSAAFAGWMAEDKIRKRTFKSYMKLITTRGIENETDLKQRIISDTSVMLERLSWYVHDLSWMLCVLSIAIAGLLLTAFKQSCMIVLVYLLLALVTWLFFSRLIRDARKGYVDALNSALYGIENLLCFMDVDPILAAQKKWQFSDTAFKNIYTSISRLTWFKSLFAQIFVFFAGLLLVGVYGMYEYGSFEKSDFLFLMSLMLTIETQASNLVLALSGFNSQQNSLDRIVEYDNCSKLDHFSPVISEENGMFIIPKRKTLNTLSEIEYMDIPMGKALSLVGQSGSGKSTFLKLLSGLEQNENKHHQTELLKSVSCLYLDRDSVDIFLWLKLIESRENFNPDFLFSFLLKKISLNQHTFIMLDEILTVWTLPKAKEFCLRLADYIANLRATVVIVDHRFSINYSIHVSEIWNAK